jgi:hypothetical protein
MARSHYKTETREVQQRAAEVRSHWSSLEKIQRTGLPPDVPARLRQFILGDSQPAWSVVANRIGKKTLRLRPV